MRTKLFLKQAEEAASALVLHGGEHTEGHVNSTMQIKQGNLVLEENAGEKDRAPHKFKRAKRDEKKLPAEKSLGKLQKKKRGGEDLMDVELDGPFDAK